jgi:DNA-binding transcriptional ArsR family regulator
VKTTAAHTTLERLLGSRLRAKLLGWLLTHPGERYFVRQLAALVGEDSTNVSREVARLQELGIVDVLYEGQQKYVRADPSSPLYPELRGLVLKTAGLVGLLQEALAPLKDRIRVAFVFGSMAAGREGPASDVDLFVVGEVSLRELVECLAPVQGDLGREVNPTVYSAAELEEKLSQGHHFVTRILQGPTMLVMGRSDELERLAQLRMAD